MSVTTPHSHLFLALAQAVGEAMETAKNGTAEGKTNTQNLETASDPGGHMTSTKGASRIARGKIERQAQHAIM